MTSIGDVAVKVRSKNAGPFWLTIDIFCGSSAVFQQVSNGLDSARVAERFAIQPAELKRFDIAALNTVKLSLPRPSVQGTRQDRDMHGASFAQVVSAMQI